MNYRLVVLTHGRTEVLAHALESFCEHVTPMPDAAYIYADGMDALPRAESAAKHFESWPWQIGHSVEPSGFCEATRHAWKMASTTLPETTHVFWLEHDFVFTRPVNLEALARVMATQSAISGEPLAQMSLMRDAVNAHEKAHGGLYESRKAEYRNEGKWLSHHSYFTTNPSLMTSRFMRENPWPRHGPECEGRFGVQVANNGFRFGVWGDGSVYVKHIGVRDGHGYQTVPLDGRSAVILGAALLALLIVAAVAVLADRL